MSGKGSMKEMCGMPIVKENEDFISLEVKKECVANSVIVTWRPSQVRTGKYSLELATNIYDLKYHLIGDSSSLVLWQPHQAANSLETWKQLKVLRFFPMCYSYAILLSYR